VAHRLFHPPCRPSPAMVVALIALFISLGGGAYAAVSIPANGVGSKQLKNGAVIESKLANNAVTSAKVKDGSLLARDFAAGQLQAGPQGAAGPQGPVGPAGAPGIPGPAGSSLSAEFTTTGTTTLLAGGPNTVLPGSGTINTVAGENHLVVNGFVQVSDSAMSPSWIDANCHAVVDGAGVLPISSSHLVPYAVGQVVIGTRALVGPGTHTVQVACDADATGLTATGGYYTIIATS